jgi:hypothetical protein
MLIRTTAAFIIIDMALLVVASGPSVELKETERGVEVWRSLEVTGGMLVMVTNIFLIFPQVASLLVGFPEMNLIFPLAPLATAASSEVRVALSARSSTWFSFPPA